MSQALREVPPCGTVVLSMAGRDAGRYFIVVGQADADHVLLCDGLTHKLDHPKKKKYKHLRGKPGDTGDIRDRLSKGNGLLDADIRRALQALGYMLIGKALEGLKEG